MATLHHAGWWWSSWSTLGSLDLTIVPGPPFCSKQLWFGNIVILWPFLCDLALTKIESIVICQFVNGFDIVTSWFALWSLAILKNCVPKYVSWKLWALPRTLKEILQPLNDQEDEKKNGKKKDLQQKNQTTCSWRPAKKGGNKMFLHFIQVVKMKANIILLVCVRKGRGRVRHGLTVRVRAFQV